MSLFGTFAAGSIDVTPNQRWILFLIFSLLFAGIGIAALCAAIGFLPSADPLFRKWAVAVLVADIAAAVIAVFKAHFAQTEARAHVNVGFPGKRPFEIDLVECQFEVRNGENSLKKQGVATAVRGNGGWQCQFSFSAEASDVVRLILKESSGAVWTVQNFSPTTVDVLADRGTP